MGESTGSGDREDNWEANLRQYLYLGKEYPNYQPGCWYVHKYYEQSRVPSIKKLAEREDPLVAVELIKKV